MSPRIVGALAALALAAASLFGANTAAAAAPAASSGPVVDTEPLSAVLDARQRHTEFFDVEFQAAAGETRFAGAVLVVQDAVNTQPNELFVGVTLTCTSPSGKARVVETGRNVWPDAAPFAIPMALTFVTDSAGTYKCQADVMMCDPGNCTSPTGTGRVRIVTSKMNPNRYSLMFVSGPLPAWATNVNMSASGNRIIEPGTTLRMVGSFKVNDLSELVRVGAVFSVSNCIERAYPDVCKKAKKTSIQGSATATVALSLAQRATTPGTACASAKATEQTGGTSTRITWQMHHAVLATWIDKFKLSTAPGCGTTIDVVMTIRAGSGNAIAVEANSRTKITSLVHTIPGGILPLPS